MTIPKHIMDEARAVWATLPKEAAGIHAIAEALHRIDLAAEQRGREMAARIIEDELVEIYEDSPDIDVECNNLCRRALAAIRSRTEGNAE